MARVEAALRQAQEAQQTSRREVERLRNQAHAAQIEAVRLGELIDRVRHRSGQIEGELAEIEAQDRELRSHRGEADTRFEQFDAELATQQEKVESARVAYEQATRRCAARATTSARSSRRASSWNSR